MVTAYVCFASVLREGGLSGRKLRKELFISRGRSYRCCLKGLTGDDPSARGIRSWRCRYVVRFAQIILHPIFCKVPLHGILRFMLAPTLPDLIMLNREALQTLL